VTPPKIQIAYIAVTHGPKTAEFASRFVGSWLEHGPGADCELLVCSNGGPLKPEIALLFMPLDARFLPRENDAGWDVSAFQQAARQTGADMLVCMGESCYFWKSGWLQRMVEAWQHYGPGMYGFFATHAVRAHLNTSAFCIDPKLLARFPTVASNGGRYEFEHGRRSFWLWVMQQRRPAVFVTWKGFYPPGEWRRSGNGLNSGDQSDLLVRCNHCDRYDAADARTKAAWKRGADAPFR
jgi:hypothetical protein